MHDQCVLDVTVLYMSVKKCRFLQISKFKASRSRSDPFFPLSVIDL